MKTHAGKLAGTWHASRYNIHFILLLSLGAFTWPQGGVAQGPLANQQPFQEMVFIDTSDPVQLKAHIEQWLAVWLNPPNVEAELEALNALFGSPINGQPYVPPAHVKKRLINRRLNYEHWESRRWAVNGFNRFVSDGGDPEVFVSIFRDASNDPHPKVREEAIFGMGTVMSVIENGGPVLGEEWDAGTKKRIAERGDDLIDMIIDFVITKGLTDESEGVVEQADLLLVSPESPPRKVWLRALDRILSKKAICVADYANSAAILRSQWHCEIYKVKRPAREIPENEADPFGGGR